MKTDFNYAVIANEAMEVAKSRSSKKGGELAGLSQASQMIINTVAMVEQSSYLPHQKLQMLLPLVPRALKVKVLEQEPKLQLEAAMDALQYVVHTYEGDYMFMEVWNRNTRAVNKATQQVVAFTGKEELTMDELRMTADDVEAVVEVQEAPKQITAKVTKTKK